MKKIKNKKKAHKSLSIIYFIPLLLIVTLVPFIVRVHLLEVGEPAVYFWPKGAQYLDFYSYNKYICISILTALATIIFASGIINKKIEYKLGRNYNIFLLIYAAMTILSTIFSLFPHTAIYGFPDMMQGLPVLLSYILLVIIVSNQVDNEKHIKWFLNAFLILAIVEGLIGMGQYFGHDLLQTSFIKSLIVSSDIEFASKIEFIPFSKTINGTLFNTNFVGSYGVLVVPITACLLANTENKKQGIIYGIATILALFTLLGSNSMAGYIGGIIAFIFAVIMLRKVIVAKPKLSALVALALLVYLALFNLVSDGYFLQEFTSLIPSSASDEGGNIEETEKVILEDVSIDGYYVDVKTNYQEVRIKYDDGKVDFINKNDEILDKEARDDNFYYIDGEGNDSVSFGLSNKKEVYYIKIDDEIVPIYNSDSSKLIGIANRLYEPVNPEKIDFLDKIGGFASGRGYIWSRSIPILKDTIFLGAGPDCFIYAFPQDEIVGKLNNLRSYNLAVDKPHNMYLQIGINTGVISLIAFLGICIIYVFSSIKLLWKSTYERFIERVNLAFLISVVGYLVTALANDQINSVAPLFYVILGLGIAANRICKVEKQKQECVQNEKETE